VHSKKDSTGICFIGERRFKDFLTQYLPAQPGKIIDESGQIIGEHSGLMYHTIGQRQGLGIGGVKDAPDAPWYVAEKDLEKNQLLVVQGKNNPLLFHNALTANQVHWINKMPASESIRCEAKVRYRQADQKCTVNLINNKGETTLHVIFDEPQRAITPGQSLVLYNGEHCLGGAVIQARHRIE